MSIGSVFTWRHDSHIDVSKQRKGGQVGAPHQSWGSWNLLSYKHVNFSQLFCMGAGHLSKNALIIYSTV